MVFKTTVLPPAFGPVIRIIFFSSINELRGTVPSLPNFFKSIGCLASRILNGFESSIKGKSPIISIEYFAAENISSITPIVLSEFVSSKLTLPIFFVSSLKSLSISRRSANDKETISLLSSSVCSGSI